MLLDKNLILFENEKKSKLDILTKFTETALCNNKVKDGEAFIKGIYEREEIFSTAIGFGIAIPHVKSEIINEPFLGFIKLGEEIEWEDEEKSMVDTVFVIGVPKEYEGNLHLKILASISQKLMDEEYRDALLNLKNIDDVMKMLDIKVEY